MIETGHRGEEADDSALVVIRAAYEAALDGVIGIDDLGAVVVFNAAAEQIFGYSESEVLGRELAELIVPPARRGEHRDGLARFRATGETRLAGRRLELSALRADGSEFPMELTVTRAASGPYFVAFVRDLSEQDRFALRSAMRYEVTSILAAAPSIETAAPQIIAEMGRALGWQFGAVWLVERETALLHAVATWSESDADRSALEALTRELKFKRGSGFPGQVWEKAESVWIDDFALDPFPRSPRAAEVGLHAAFAAPIVRGGRFFGLLEFFAASIQPPDEDLLRMATAVGNQIAQALERAEAEDDLRSSEARYRDLFELNPRPMWVFDPETLRFLAVNDAAEQLYGYTEQEFLALTIADIRPEEDAELVRDSVGTSSGAADTEVWQHRKKDGTPLEVAISTAWVDFDGKPARIVCATDVTEERRLEAIARRSQKLEAIGRLAGGVAHDFNNVLVVIRSYCELLARAVTDGKLSGYVGEIDAAAEHAGQITRQLLAFSSQQVVQPKPTDLNAVVRDSIDMLRALVGSDVTIESTLDPGLATIVVDPGQIHQLVVNLAVNARDAMPGGGTLSIHTANVFLAKEDVVVRPGIKAGRFVLLRITDTGMGMDRETSTRIFEPFFTTKEDGTGLGLSTVHGIVGQCGGHIWVYSEPGLGTTFKVYLPAETAAQAASDEPGASPVDARGAETILVVEDAPQVRSLVTNTLAEYGYRVLSAARPREALEIAAEQNGRIDLLLSDVVLPEMNGRELAERLHGIQENLRVLYTSGYPADAVLRHGIAQAEVPFIEKPFLPADLARKVREVLDLPEA